MSSFRRWTKHPKTDEWFAAYWLDDALGHHHYGVKFEGDDTIYDPDKIILETDKERELPDWEGAESIEVGADPNFNETFDDKLLQILVGVSQYKDISSVENIKLSPAQGLAQIKALYQAEVTPKVEKMMADMQRILDESQAQLDSLKRVEYIVGGEL